MNTKEIFEKYPKASKKLGEYMVDVMMKSFKDDENIEEIKESLKENQDGLIESIISSNSRILYDFFDKNSLFISIEYFIESEPSFGWSLGNVTNMEIAFQSRHWESRQEAEEEAFYKTFEKLNEL